MRRYNYGAQLHHTIGKGNKKEILDFLKYQTVDLEVTDSDGNTVLHLVIENKKLMEKEILKISQLFISRGIDPNTTNHSEETALHLAVANRMKTIVNLLIQHNVETDIRDSKGNLITHYFIEVEYKKFSQKLGPGPTDLRNDSLHDWDIEEMEIKSAIFVEWLMSKGFDFDSQNGNEQTAVYLATQYNLQHILPVLLKYTKCIDYINYRGETLLCCFLSRDYKPGIYFEKFYQKRYADTIVKILLEKGVSLDVFDNTNRTTLQIAIEQDEDMRIINLLVNHFPKDCDKSHIATSRLYQIMCSCQSWNSSKIDCYLKILSDVVAKRANVNYQDERTGTTPLYYAVKWKNLHVVKFLQENGANFQVKTKNGQNLLYQVLEENCDLKWNVEVESSQLEIFEILMNEGCEVNVVDEDGLSPLHLAARLKNTSILLKLIERGADVNCMTVNMTTPLHYALTNPVDAVNACKLLVDHGANVNAKNRWGTRPIHLVGNIKEVEHVNSILIILLKRGAYLNALDENGKSVLHRALVRDQTTAVIRELLKWRANVGEDCIIDLINSGRNIRRSSRLLLIKHWFKLNLEIIKSPYQRKYRSCVFFSMYVCPEYRPQCLEELTLMKAYMVNSRTSLYSLLHMHPSDRSIYVNNEKFLSIVGSSVINEQFPKYSVIILSAYREAVAWKTLVESAKIAWLDLTGIRLPDICIKLIFAYFNNDELIKVIDRDCNTLPNGNVGAFKLLYEQNF